MMSRGQREDSDIMGRGSVKEWTVELLKMGRGQRVGNGIMGRVRFRMHSRFVG